MLHLAGFSLIVPDVGATVDFYQRAFGLELRYLHPTGQYAEMLTGPVLLSFTSESLWENMMLGADVEYGRAAPDRTPWPNYVALTAVDLMQRSSARSRPERES